jgi:hypothetical protein
LAVKVRLKSGELHGSWSKRGTEYVVLSVEAIGAGRVGCRIASEDRGMPVVFSLEDFEVCDGRIPVSWRILGVHGATVDLGPEEFAKEGFWEAVFDLDSEALAAYHQVKERIVRESD